MSNFIKEMIELDDKIKLDRIEKVEHEDLKVAFLPYYVDPETMKLTVVLKREILSGAYHKTGKKLGITALSTILPSDKNLTIEEAFNKLDLPATLQNSIPIGGVMTNPKNSTEAYEIVLVQIDPIELLDETRGIVKQVKGEYEIGVVNFDELLEAIHENYIQDIIVRFMLGELYILAMEEANKSNENIEQNSLENEYSSIGDEELKSDNKNDNINTQTDYGKLYSRS